MLNCHVWTVLVLYSMAYCMNGRFLSARRTWPRDEDGTLEVGTTICVSLFYEKCSYSLCSKRLVIIKILLFLDLILDSNVWYKHIPLNVTF